MTWFKVDDSFYRSRKIRRLGPDRVPAVGLWTLCGNWAADNLTDGFVPWEIVGEWDPRRRYAQRLIDVELWLDAFVDDEQGIGFHDWADYQPSRAQVIAERASNARRTALHRDPELTAAIRNRDRNRCRYCGTAVNWSDRRGKQGGTYDHVDPVGGNSLANCVVACRACTATKRVRTPHAAGMPLLPPGTLPGDTGTNVVSGSDLGTSQIQLGSVSAPYKTPTRPDPLSTSSGYVGGESLDPYGQDQSAPPKIDLSNPRCDEHVTFAATRRGPNCQACKAAREWAVTERKRIRDQAKTDRRAAITACPRCDDGSWLIDTETGVSIEPAVRCDHRKVDTESGAS